MDRIRLLTYLVERYHYTSYLEIGCYDNDCFDVIQCSTKVGVDPEKGGTHRMTSDEFFQHVSMGFDLVFIDGLHYSEQVIRDVLNSLKCLNPGGTIVLHDCNPPTPVHASWPRLPNTPSWNGDVWKAIVLFRQLSSLDTIVGDFDWGCGIIRKGKNTKPLHVDRWHTSLSFNDLQLNRKEWLRLSTFQEIEQWLSNQDV